MSTSCETPLSWFSKWIVNGLPAGADRADLSNFRFAPVSARLPGPRAPDPLGPPDPVGPPDAVAPPAPAVAWCGGNQPALKAMAAMRRTPKVARRFLGQAGAGSFSRWPVASALTTWRYSLRAS